MSSSASRTGSSSSKLRDKDGNMVDHLRSMQQMERETQETLSKFMSALSQRTETDYAGLLEEKISELQASEADNNRLRSEMDKYEDRIEQLQKNEDRIMKEKGQIMDEKLRAGKAATQADQIIKNLQSQMRAMEQKHTQEMEVKLSMLKNLEEENLRSKVHSDEAQARLEAFTHETAELHSAMASLHGEIAAQQRELDESKERDQRNTRQKKELNIRLEERETEMGRLKGERRNLEARLTDVEKKLNEASLGADQANKEGKTAIDQLARERDSVQGSLAKMGHKLQQQMSTSKELNQALQRMRIELSNAQESSSREQARADAATRDTQSLQIVVSSLERSKTEADALAQRLEQDKLGITSDLTQANERITTLLAEARKTASNSEKFERQRTELTVELSCRTKELEVIKKNIEVLTVDLEDNRARLDTERNNKERSLEKLGVLESELERARNELREQAENIESQARQLRESERMREQALETSRAQQRENANRIIEFSQKNAKLSSELSAKDDEIHSLKRGREDAQSRGVESSKELDDIKNQYLSTRVRLQALEDEHELSIAKYEASKSENEQLRAQIKQEIKVREDSIAVLLEKHDVAVAAMSERLEAEADEKAAVAEAIRKEAEDRLNRAITKEKEMHKAVLDDAQNARQEDSEIQRARLGTLAKAMESLQAELRDESSKNANLTQELSVLKELAEVGNTEMQERINYVERERSRERTRLEGQLIDIKEQLRTQGEQKQQRDQLMSTIEQQLTRERESKFSALQRVRAAEDEANSLTAQVDSLNEECTSLRKDVRGFERKLALAVQSKDAEILRLTRRNEVLGEAVTRLTASSQDTLSNSASKAINKFFTTGVKFSTPGDDGLAGLSFTSTNNNATASPSLTENPEIISENQTNSEHSMRSSLERMAVEPDQEKYPHVSVFFPTTPEVDHVTDDEERDPSEQPTTMPVSSTSVPDIAKNVEDTSFDSKVLTRHSFASGEHEVSPLSSSKSNINLINSYGNVELCDDETEIGSRFKENLKVSVEAGKGLQLDFSPKRAQSAPVQMTRKQDDGKENSFETTTKIPKPTFAKSSDRIKRASQFIKARQATSSSAKQHRKPPVF